MKGFSKFLPLTHPVAISRAVYAGVYPKSLVTDVLVILGLEAVAFTVAVTLMKKRLVK